MGGIVAYHFEDTPMNDVVYTNRLATRGLRDKIPQDHWRPTLATRMRDLLLSGEHAKLTMQSDELTVARDLSAGTFTAGGALVGTENLPLERLISGAELADLGVTIRGGLAGPATVPRATALPTGAWIPAEGASMTESQPTFGQIGLTPHYLACLTDVSRQLALQAGSDVVDAVVGPLNAESTRRNIFTALFSGSGTSGAPLGLLNTAGIGTVSGTSLGATGLRSMLRQSLAAGAREANIRFVADPATAELLGSREFSTGSGLPCWYDGKVLGRPAIATNLMPASTIVCGDFSRATVWLFDRNGLGLEVDPYAGFASGWVRFRLIVGIDLSFSPSAAFVVSTSTT
jgi:HK97 family phage major capsid protein